MAQILHGSITIDLSEPHGNLGKILVRSLWPNLTFKTSHELKILVQFSCLSLFRLDKILPCFLARLYLDQILPGTSEELGVNLGKILAIRILQGNLVFSSKILARSWEIF